MYRYSIGVLAEAADAFADSAALEALRACLPESMRADAQPAAYDESLRQVDADAQNKQFVESAAALTVLKWSSAWGCLLYTSPSPRDS